jgi:hypothetical protein
MIYEHGIFFGIKTRNIIKRNEKDNLDNNTADFPWIPGSIIAGEAMDP